MSPTTTVRAAPNSNSSLMIKKLAGDLFRPARFDYNTTTDRATNVRHLPRGATVVKDFAPHQATKLLKPGTARERRGRGRGSFRRRNGRMLVESLMTRDVEVCRPDSPPPLAPPAAVGGRRDCGVVPVTEEGGELVGVVTDRDICMALSMRGQRAGDVRVAEVMTSGVEVCT